MTTDLHKNSNPNISSYFASMDSCFHIDTDIQCSVLHYGKEVCIAIPREDVTINLRKGRHRLTFISKENPADQLTIMYEVPENDYEDCIEVCLSPIRDARLARESEERKKAYEAELERKLKEKEQKELEERRRLEEERERKRKAEEEVRLREDKAKEAEWREKMKPFVRIFREAKSYDEKYRGAWRADYTLFPRRFKNGKIGFINHHGEKIIQPRFDLKLNTPNIYGFHEGLSCVIEEYVPTTVKYGEAEQLAEKFDGFDAKIAFVNSDGESALSSNYFLPRTTLNYQRTPILYPFFSQDRVIVQQRESIGTKQVVIKGYSTDDKWNTFVKNPSPAIILERKFSDDGKTVKECLVELPVYSNPKYIIIDKQGNQHCEITPKLGYTPLFNPFSQGLSVIVWVNKKSRTGTVEIIEVIDREGNTIINYEVNPGVELGWGGKSCSEWPGYRDPTVFLGEHAFFPVAKETSEYYDYRTYLQINLDGTYSVEKLYCITMSDRYERGKLNGINDSYTGHSGLSL